MNTATLGILKCVSKFEKFFSPPVPVAVFNNVEERDDNRNQAYLNDDVSIVYESWLFFDAESGLTSNDDEAPFNSAWRRNMESSEVIWAVSEQFEQLQFLRLRAWKLFNFDAVTLPDRFTAMAAVYKKAAEVSKLSKQELSELTTFWPELSEGNLEKVSCVCNALAHMEILASFPETDIQAAGFRALRTFLVSEDAVPANARVDENSAASDAEVLLQQLSDAAFFMSLVANGEHAFKKGEVTHSAALLNHALFGCKIPVANIFEPSYIKTVTSQCEAYNYVVLKTGKKKAIYNKSMLLECIALPDIAVRFADIYELFANC